MCNFSEKALIERIIELRISYSGSRGRSKFAAAIGISPSSYNYYEKDRVPPIPILLKICELCDVSIGWLLTGDTDQDLSLQQSGDGRFSVLFERIRQIYAQNPESLGSIQAFIDLLAEQNQLEQQISAPVKSSGTGAKKGWIPVLGRTAAGVLGDWSQTNLADSKALEVSLADLVKKHTGYAVIGKNRCFVTADLPTKPILSVVDSKSISLIQTAGSDSDEVFQFLDCPGVYDLFKDCFALQVDGDSMAPRINDGDFVILSPSATAVEGQPAVVKVSGSIGVTCKIPTFEGNRVHLVPLNEKYETKVVESDEILWSLAVLCHIKLKNLDL